MTARRHTSRSTRATALTRALVGVRAGAVRLTPYLVFLLPLVVSAGDALARVGGGQSFGGGRRGGGGGGGGGDAGFLIDILFWLVIRNPQIGLPIVLGIIIWAVIRHYRGKRHGPVTDDVVLRQALRGRVRRIDFAALRKRDANFSEPLFVDLVNLIFTRAHEARSTGAFDHLRAYLAPGVAEALGAGKPVPVKDVIVGSTRVESVVVGSPDSRITVLFDANVTERGQQLLRRERWVFERHTDTLSPGPEQMQALRCPSCGAASETRVDGTCVHCDTPIADARLQWRAASVTVLTATPIEPPPLELGSGMEVGTDFPTVVDPRLPAELRALAGRDPAFRWNDFATFVREVFHKLQDAWAAKEWERARPYETDAMFQVHRFWVERYRAAGLTNHAADVKVTRVEPAKLTRDAYLDAFTVRIHARMRDWTTDASGKVVAGDKGRERVFTEYWTFVRTVGVHTPDRASLDNCPSCGAALDRVDQGGVCGYCGTKIVGGQHGWVLSAITQDEVYAG